MNLLTRRLRRLAPQIIALAIILALITAIAPGFLTISFQNGRLFQQVREPARRQSAAGPA